MTTPKFFHLIDSQIARDTVQVGEKLYFVYHGVQGRPVSLISRTGRTIETAHERVSMSEPVTTYLQYEFVELEPVRGTMYDTVIRAWEFERDLNGFELEAYPHENAEQLASAQMAYVEMIRSGYAQRPVRRADVYWTTETFVPAPDPVDPLDEYRL